MSRLHIRVDNRIRFQRAGAPEGLISELKDAFEHDNPERAKLRVLGRYCDHLPSKIATWRSDGEEFSIPRGGMGRLREVLEEKDVRYRVEDARTEGSPSPSFPKYVGAPLRWYQEEAVASILRKEQGIIRAPTGCGKTTLAFAAIARVGLNALVILPTSGLFDQWARRAERELGLRPAELGMLGGGKSKRLRPVTIAIQNTLNSMRERGSLAEVHEYFGHVIFDEAQLAAARTVNETLDTFPARYRVAVSADERRSDKKEFLTYDQFGDVIQEVDRKVLEKQRHVLDVAIMVVPTEFRADWYGVANDDAPAREVDFNRLLDEMVKDEARNALALRFVDEELGRGSQCIMLTGRREHVRMLDRHFVENRIESGFLLGDQEAGDKAEFDRTVSGLLRGDIRVGIGTYKALGFGIDLPAVAAGVAVTPISANPQFLNQVRGRLCRPSEGKSMGRLYVLLDHLVYPRHIDTLIAKNKTVLAWHRGSWVDGRAWRREMRAKGLLKR